MSQDEVTRSILKVMEPTVPDWRQTLEARQLDGIYTVMYGAAISLLKCKELLAAPTSNKITELYDIDRLHADLVAAANSKDPFPWDHNQNLLTWSIGYFVNRAEHNICSVFDRLLSAWIALHVGWDLAANDSENIWMTSWPTTRARVLHAFLMKDSKAEALLPLVANAIQVFGDGTLADTSTAIPELKRLAESLEPYVNSDLGTFVSAVSIADGHCLALTWARTNAFKHRVKTGTPIHTNRSLALCTEWAVAVRAFTFVGRCWEAMLQNVLAQKDSTHSSGV